MPQYRYLVGDLVTGTLREEMPFADVKYSNVLNGPGGFAATIGLRHPKATRANLDPGRTAIYVERDGVLLGGWILWTAVASADDARVNLAGKGFWSYFRRRHLTTTKAYTAVDQFAIAQDLLDWAQDQAGGDIGVTIGTETSGVLRDRIYNSWERVNVGETIEKLAAVEGGFDFSIDVAYDTDGTITKTFRPAYPQRGRDTDIVLELGVNTSSFSQQIDAEAQANHIDVIGAGDGSSMLIATVEDPDVLGIYPRLDDVLAFKDVTQSDTLEGHGLAALAARSTPLKTLPTLAQEGPETGLGSYITGDTVTCRARAGYLEVDERMRIVEIGVAVSDEGGEAVGIALQPASDFV